MQIIKIERSTILPIAKVEKAFLVQFQQIARREPKRDQQTSAV